MIDVEIVEVASAARVMASLRDDLAPHDLVLVDRAWMRARERLVAQLDAHKVPRRDWPQSLLWDWSRKAPALKRLEARAFSITCNERVQGVMLTRSALYTARVPADHNRPLIYIDFLESAPWNWRIPAIGQLAKFKGLGSLFVRDAVRLSIEEGFHGRVGLHSLPQSESFYEKHCGMTSFGPDAKKDSLVYFEFTRDQAAAFVNWRSDL